MPQAVTTTESAAAAMNKITSGVMAHSVSITGGGFMLARLAIELGWDSGPMPIPLAQLLVLHALLRR